MRRRYTYTYYRTKKRKRKADPRVILAFAAALAVSLGLFRVARGTATSAKYAKYGEAETYYLIELARFDDRLSAEVYAETGRERGGAGYVAEDGGFRVFVACYLTEADARAVASGMNAVGEKASIYRAVIAPAELKTASGVGEKVAEGYRRLDRTIARLYEVSLGLDTGMLRKKSARLEIEGLLSEFRAAAARLRGGEGKACRALDALLSAAEAEIASLVGGDGPTAGGVRESTLRLVFRFRDFSETV